MQKSKVKIYKIKGMDCPSCASLLELDLEDAGVSCKCSYASGRLEVTGDHDPEKIIETVKKLGYLVSPD